MVRFSFFLILLILASTPTCSEEIPFSAAPALQPSGNNAYVPSLNEIMEIVQLEHIKLWQAGSAKNWRLAAFETDRIRDTFLRTATFYDGMPTKYVVAVDAPLREMKIASTAGDPLAYAAGYARLTAACNACHQAANVGFIVVVTPASPTAADQKF